MASTPPRSAHPVPAARRRPRSLAQEVVDSLQARMRDGQWAPGDKLPTEAAVMDELGVSRTVVREALSRLQAAGWVETRHGIGTFVCEPPAASDATGFRIQASQMATLREVVAVLELRIGVESESAALAAQRRTPANLANLRAALAAFSQAVAEGRDAVAADFEFHLEVARATQNTHFVDLLASLGTLIIPRARLTGEADAAARQAYLQRVNGEHQRVLAAIEAQDADAAREAMRAHLSHSLARRLRTQVQD